MPVMCASMPGRDNHTSFLLRFVFGCAPFESGWLLEMPPIVLKQLVRQLLIKKKRISVEFNNKLNSLKKLQM